MRRRFAVALLFVLPALLLTLAPVALGAPVWNLEIHHNETNLPPGGTGQYWFEVDNVGDTPSTGVTTVTIHLPSGITRDQTIIPTLGTTENSFPLAAVWSCPGAPRQTVITCATASALPHHTLAELPLLSVDVSPSASGERFVTATVSGGGASAPVTASEPTQISPEAAPFGIVDGSFKADFYEADGLTSVRQSGGHPDLATFAFDFNSVTPEGSTLPTKKFPAGTVRDVRVDLPPGFIGNPTAIAECTPAELTGASCPPASQVGRFDALVSFNAADTYQQLSTGVFNMTHPKGAVADLAFSVAGNPIHVKASLDPARNYAIKTTVSEINETTPVYNQQVTLWGAPADPSHDSERCPGFSDGTWGGNTSGSCPAGVPVKPFLTVPFDCTTSDQMTLSGVDSWQSPGVFGPELTFEMPGLQTGCGLSQEQFKPSLSVTPTSAVADSPTGLNVDFSIPQNSDLSGVSTPPVKRIRVTLPEGMSLNPSFADGLEGCTEAQIGISAAGVPDESPVTCPDQSRIGAIEISSPLLPGPLEGSIYLAKQEANPSGSLFALYAVVHDTEERGVLLKIPGAISLDPSTGQVTTTFDDLPEFPAEELSVQFRGGDRAPLVNPATCGTGTISSTLDSWSETSADVAADSSYEVTQAPGGGACATGLASRAFAPQLSGGSTDTTAGVYSPLVLRLTRNDGERELTQINADLPKGLVGKLAGVAECSDAVLAAIPTAPGTGAAEKANPSCPADSRIGYLNVGSGAGPLPFYVPGTLYFTGPYKGAPFSIAAVTPAVAGGIDLGNVVIRSALFIDPNDSHVHVVSDPIPTILHGVALHLRDVRIVVDRSQFTLNPTSCDPMALTGTIGGSEGISAAVSDRFQVADCAGLAFKPSFAASTSGKTSKADGASLSVKLTYPNTPQGTEANIAKVKVELPKQLPSRLTTLQKACTAAQFNANPAGCPAESIVGTAVAHTPILSQPLTGPAYFVSRGGEAFPQLVVVLQGQGITVDLVGNTFISKAGITSSTFASVPDVPVSSFELTLPQGKYSALAANGNLCSTKLAMPTEFVAQNGAATHQSTPIDVEGCPNSIAVVSHAVKGRKLTVSVSVPAPGKLAASGKGLSKASKVAKGRETLKLTLHTTKGGKLSTRVRLTFTPAKGTTQTRSLKPLSTTLKVKFKK